MANIPVPATPGTQAPGPAQTTPGPMGPAPIPNPANLTVPGGLQLRGGNGAVQPRPFPTMVPMPPPKWHDVTFKRTRKIERAVVAPVPPEEFGISRFARNFHDCGYCFHEVIKRQSDMVEQGYDPVQLNNVSTYSAMTNQEELARDTVEERQGVTGDGGLNRANRELKITEHYLKLDYEGDGKPAMYRITTGGDPSQILRRRVKNSKKYAEEIVRIDGPPPFAAITPVPMPHRFFGRSIADLVMDIQKIKTVIMRNCLNNIYQRGNQRVEVPETAVGQSTIDDLLTARPMGIVRTKAPGQIQVMETPDITQSAFPMLQLLDTQREWRSGLSRQGQGVDPNSLQNQVATIANQMHDTTQGKVKLIARIFAETGLKDLFRLLHATIRKHGSQKQTVRLRNKWIEVDPREWKARADMTINVGLGSGNKAMQLAQLQILIGAQTQAVQAGLISQRNLWNSAGELVRLVKPGAATGTFFTDPGQPPNPNDPASAALPPPPPKGQTDPKQAQMELQLKAQQSQADAQIKQQSAQWDMAIKSKQAEAQIAAEQARVQGESALNEQKHQYDMQIQAMEAQRDQERHQMEMRKNEMDMMHAHEKHQADLAQVGQKAQAKAAPMNAVLERHAKALQEHSKLLTAPRDFIRDKNGRLTRVQIAKE